ncbi:hypothetical protein PV328_006116 [Microctonus aethiopoides]|uniref:Glycosyltransferase family 92 protein n=1 Tax=Microctonus aethiopoides TaxID=144406 RepID=A0AA39FP75_9HYME|nr:hypothetical protein PV328_006116 [Microctonus aethiopoides]
MGTRRAGFGLTITNGSTSVTGTSNLNFSRSNAGILKDRANMSFMLVIMFFAVFGLIVLTEIFLIDERRGVNGRTNVHGGSHPNSLHRLVPMPDRPDYEEVAGDFADEYISFKGAFDSPIGLLVMNNNDKTSNNGDTKHRNNYHLAYNPKSLSNLIPLNIEKQLPTLDKNLQITHAEWLPVTNTRFKFFVYSAYFDDRVSHPTSTNYMNINIKNIKMPSDIVISGDSGTTNNSYNNNNNNNNNNNSNKSREPSSKKKKNLGLIRVIGATKTRTPERVWCRLWYRHNDYDPAHPNNITNLSITVAARVQIIRENWNLKYSACFIICPLPNNISNNVEHPAKLYIHNFIPEAVSIVARLRASPTNRIHIQNRPQDRPVERQNLAICVKPLHFNYNRVLQLVEFIELYKILGANHIILYNDTIGDETGCTLEYYEKTRGLVSLLPWHGLDMISQREIRTEALFAALNDCLYRSMYKYEYVALVDLDEFIIPRHNDTIIQLIRWMTSRMNSKSTSALSFQNAFFYLQWPDDPLISVTKSLAQAGLVTLRKTRRRLKLHPHKQRSKYICKPRDIVEAGNHFVWEFLAGHGTLNVPSDAAILHHYRVCEFGGDDCVKTPSVVDKTAYKYKNQLTNDVNESWSELGKICRLPQLEPIPRQLPQGQRHPLFIPNNMLNDMKTQQYSVDFLTNPTRIV